MSDMPSVVVLSLSPCLDRYAWFEWFRLGTTNRPVRVEVRPGGKGMNASRVLVALGASVSVIAPIAPVEQAWWIQRAAREDIEVLPVAATGVMRMSMTFIDEAVGSATEVYEPSRPLESASWAALEAAAMSAIRRTPPPDAILVCGSSRGDDGGALARVVKTCRSAGIPVSIDGHGAAVATAIRSGPAVLKVNLEEARGILADPMVDAEHAAHDLRRAGAVVAVVTVGAQGATCFDGRRLLRVPGPTRPGPYPGGSGDAFFAALTMASLEGSGLEESLDAARRVAEANATSPYAGWADTSAGHPPRSAAP